MKIHDLQKHFELIAPSAIAWKGDNIGLLLGRENDPITNVIVALDVTMKVAEEAKKRNANCIVTHHPLIFQPLRRITPNNRVGELVLFLAEHKINLYAAHTNIDSVQWGVNITLGKHLGLHDLRILSPIKESLTKIAVFVPESHLEVVAAAMHEAGAGMFSKYDNCSFRSEGIGTFRGMNDAQPFVGKKGALEKAKETRLEMLAETWKLKSVVGSMLKAHPYEEVAYDIYPLLNHNTEYGLGAIGMLPKKISRTQFLALVKKKLGVKVVRYSGSKEAIQRVAVCGGSGSDYIAEAIGQQADAIVTADLKYHTFQEFEEKILVVDAGHYETEQVVLPVLARKIEEMFAAKGHAGKVFVTRHNTNPVHIF